MNDRLLNLIQQIVRQELARQRTSLLGVVTAVFPHEAADDNNNYEANVRLKHEDLELRQVPIAVPYVGVATPPRVDDLVLVHFINGDLNQPVINGRFYHADERPPLHTEDEILFEHRLPDDTLNHLRFANDGTIYIQRDVTKSEDSNPTEALTSVKIDGETGSIDIKVGEDIGITLTNDDNIQVTAEGKPINVTGSDVTIDCDQLIVNGDLVVNGTGTTTISGNTITGS